MLLKGVLNISIHMHFMYFFDSPTLLSQIVSAKIGQFTQNITKNIVDRLYQFKGSSLSILHIFLIPFELKNRTGNFSLLRFAFL